jgi:predicted SnoaL-like aldol condensation-catalyzing enzyme
MFDQWTPRGHRSVWGATNIQHIPGAADEKDGFIAYFEEPAQEYSGKRVEFKRVIAEENYVGLRCRQEWPGEHDLAGIAILRLDENGKVVEHRGIAQSFVL